MKWAVISKACCIYGTTTGSFMVKVVLVGSYPRRTRRRSVHAPRGLGEDRPAFHSSDGIFCNSRVLKSLDRLFLFSSETLIMRLVSCKMFSGRALLSLLGIFHAVKKCCPRRNYWHDSIPQKESFITEWHRKKTKKKKGLEFSASSHLVSSSFHGYFFFLSSPKALFWAD